MDKSKHKDGMLAAGKKRLEKFRQQKQEKGNPAKQNKQDSDIEQGIIRSEVENDSRRGSKVKSGAVGNNFEDIKPKSSAIRNDSEDIKAKSSRMSNDSRGSTKTKPGDYSKNLRHDVSVERSSDKSSPSRIDDHPATTLHTSKSFHKKANILEKSRVIEGEMPISGNGESCITLDSSQQLQSSSIPSSSSQFRDSLDENSSNFAGRPDSYVNRADLVSLGVNGNQDGETGNPEENMPRTNWEAFQGCDQDQSGALESLMVRTPPCSSSDYLDANVMDVKSKHGDQMQRNDRSEAIASPLSYPHVPTFSDPIKGPFVGDTSWPSGHEFDTRGVGAVPSEHVLDISAEAASNVEQAHNIELNEGTFAKSQLDTKPTVNLDAGLASAVYPDVDFTTVSESSIRDSLTDSHLEGSRIEPVSYGNSLSFDLPHTCEMDVSRENTLSESSSDLRLNLRGSLPINGPGSEGSEDVFMTSLHERTAVLHGEEASHESGNFVSAMTDDRQRALKTLPVNLVGEILTESQGDCHGDEASGDVSVTSHANPAVDLDTHGAEVSDDASMTSLYGCNTDLHRKDIHYSGDSVSLTTDGSQEALETSHANPAVGLDGNGRGIEGSDYGSVILLHENTTDFLDEGLSHGSDVFVSLTTDCGQEGLESFSMKPTVEILADSQGKVAALVKNDNLEHAELDDGLAEAPSLPSFDPEKASLVNECDFNELGNSSCQDCIPVFQKESMLDKADAESKLLDGSLVDDEEVLKTVCEVSGCIEHDRTSMPLCVSNSVVHNLESMNALSGYSSSGEPSLENEALKADMALNQFSETSLPFPNHQESGIGFGNGSSPDRPLSNCLDQNTSQDGINTKLVNVSAESADFKTHCSTLGSPEEIVVVDAFVGTRQDSEIEGSILGSDNDCRIDNVDVEDQVNESLEHVTAVLEAAEEVQGFDGNEKILPSASEIVCNTSEKEERTGNIVNVKPGLELSSVSNEGKEVEEESHLHCTDSNPGLAPSAHAADNSEANPSFKGMGYSFTDICHAKQASASCLYPEGDMATNQLQKADVVAVAGQVKLETEKISVAGQAKLETERLSPPCPLEENWTQTNDVCNDQTELEQPIYEGQRELSFGSDVFPGSHQVYGAVCPLDSAADYMDKPSSPFTHANEAAGLSVIGSPSVIGSLLEHLDTNLELDYDRITRNKDLTIALESGNMNTSNMDTSNLPAETEQVGQDIKVTEGINSEEGEGQLQGGLCMKERELENMLVPASAQTDKSFEERDMFVKFTMYVVQRLNPLFHEGLSINENPESQFSMFKAAADSSIFNNFIEDFDCWMDKIQKNTEEKREMEVANQSLEKIHAMKDIEINELLKQVEGLFQKYNEVQRDMDKEQQQFKSSTILLEELLAIKDAEIERLSNEVSELTFKCDLTKDEMGKTVEERMKIEDAAQQLEAVLILKEADNTRLSNDVLELTKKFELVVLQLATAEEERSKVDGQVKELKELFSTKETDLKRMSDEMSELSQKNELALAEMGRILEENGKMEAELKHFQNLHLEQSNNVKRLEDSLLIRDTESENLRDLKVEQDSKICYLEECLLVRNTELESVQKLNNDERQGHLNLLTQTSALAEKIVKVLSAPSVSMDGNAMGALEILVTSLHDEYEALLRKNKDLTAKAIECDAAHGRELNNLRINLSVKEIELGHAHEKVDLLTKDKEGHLDMLMRANSLVEKVAILLNSPTEAVDGDAIGILEILMNSMHDQYAAITRANKDLAEKVVDCDTAYERDLNILRAHLIEKEVEMGYLHEKMDLLTKEREGHLNMLTQAGALVEKVTALLNSSVEAIDGDAIGKLEFLVSSLHDQHKSILRKHDELAARAADFDIAHERELSALNARLSEKEVQLFHIQETVDLLTKELSQTKEDGERKLLESEQKGLGYRERLSLAVTKGKGLVQQRDTLKQQLAEKILELESLNLFHEQELHAKTVALKEAESKARLNSEAGERVEALESELSYIRNSSNALRESFLQKDAVIQKIEELLEDASFPEDLQIKDTYEKLEWLLETSNQKISTLATGPSEVLPSTGLDNSSIAEQTSQTLEIDQLNKKCDEYLRKYRCMAEELAMLEQSLLERNVLIQRWEEMLDNVEMPVTIRGKEPEDKIQFLVTATADAHISIARLQAAMESLQITADNSQHSLRELQDQHSMLLSELVAKEEELQTVALDLKNMTAKSTSIPKPILESSDEICGPPVGSGGSDLNENLQEGCQQLFQIGNLAVYMPEILSLLSKALQADEVEKIFKDVSANTAFETSLKLLLENSRLWLAEACENREKLSELSLTLKNIEDGEKQVQSLHEALASKTLEVHKLDSQLEDFAAKIASLKDQVDHLQEDRKVKTEELSFVKDELNKSQLEAAQEKEKHASTREKLSMAVRKGKSVLQQRDTYRQALDDRVAELEQLKREFESEGMAFIKAKQSFRHQLLELEGELSSSKVYATTLEKSLQENNKIIQKSGEALDKIDVLGAPRSGDLMEKIYCVSQVVLDLQRKAGSNEQEAKKSKKTAELLSLELEEMQGKMDSLADELMNAEKNVSLLAEERKVAEALKAESGLRLEHAMANINSLLFEQSESKEAQAILEQENFSLKESLAAQTEEIRFMYKRVEEQLNDSYNKVHSLRAKQLVFLDRVANEFSRSSENVGGTRSLLFRTTGKVEKHDSFSGLSSRVFDKNTLFKWESENFRSKEWTQPVTIDSIRLLCEEMEVEIQHFEMFLDKAAVALNQDFAANHQLVSELHDVIDFLMKESDTSKRDAETALTREQLIQNDERIRVLEELFKALAEKLRSCLEEVEGLTGSQSADLILPISLNESWQNDAISLVEMLSSSVKNLTQSYQCAFIESEKQNEELGSQLQQAKEIINEMGQQKQIDDLEIRNYLEQLEAKDGILKRTNEELSSLHAILTTKNNEEDGLATALEKAELKIGQLSAKVEELQKQKQELEASLAKASSRFYATINNFNKFQSLSEKLIEEAESLHLLLEDRDGQISLLKNEAALKAVEMADLQNLVDERTAGLSQVYQHIGGIVNKEVSNGELPPDPVRRKEILEALSVNMRAGSESLRVQLARKDALLQDIQLRHDDLVRKVHVLESSVQESHRVMEERGATEPVMITVEAEEKGTRGKHATPSAAVVTHGRAGRKAAVEFSAVNVDLESDKLSADIDDEDKGHMLKPLTSSRLVPRGTRILVDRLDGFWVSGERLLRRKPGARLSMMLYWLVLHIWIVATLL